MPAPPGAAYCLSMVLALPRAYPGFATGSATRSLQLLQKRAANAQCMCHILRQHALIGVMAHATRSAQEQHRRRHAPRENHGVMPRSTREMVLRAGAFQKANESRVHPNGGLIELRLCRYRKTAPRSHLARVPAQDIDGTAADFIVRMTDVEAQARLSRNHIFDIRLHPDSPHRS